MRKKILLALGISAAFVFGGCSVLMPQVEPLTEAETPAPETSSDNPQTEAPDTTAEETITESETPETEDSPEDRFSTDENGNLIVDIGGTDETGSSSGRMEETKKTYSINNITINYPVLIGMSDTEAQEWANKELYEDAMSIIDLYDVDPETDTLTVDYEVSVIYRSEFSLVYSGTLEQGSNTISIRLSDDLDLSQMEHIRLADRLSASKLASTILEDGDYTVLSSNFDEETLRSYLASQSEDFYTSLIQTADFGGAEEPVGFSYNYMGNVAVIIPVPHMFGDYAEISIVQQTK